MLQTNHVLFKIDCFNLTIYVYGKVSQASLYGNYIQLT